MSAAAGFLPDAIISGWSHGHFGRREASLEQLVSEVVDEAIGSAGLAPQDIDEAYFGNFNSGIQPFASPASLIIQAQNDLWGIPVTRVENACASGSAAVHQAVKAVASGTTDHVLVVGAEKMTDADPEAVGRGLIGADYDHAGTSSTTGFTGLFAAVADAYAERYGAADEACAMIAVKNHANGLENPYAHLHKNLDYEFCATPSEKNPVIAGGIRRNDCSPVSDGAAVLVVSRRHQRSREALTAGVSFLGLGHANDYASAAQRDTLAFAGSAQAWERALSQAGIRQPDLSFVELHDCFTIAELNLYEVLGLAPRGGGPDALWTGKFHRDGALPVNISGGLKSKGHPVGATGVSQHVMAAMQLTGTAGGMQLESPRAAAVHNMGGLAVANYVSVLGAST